MNLAHLQLLDSALPIGAFSHSFGLETLVQDGRVRNANELQLFCRAMLRGAWAPCDAMAVKAVYEWNAPENWDELWEFDRAMHVARTAWETREGMRKIGKRLLTLGRDLHPGLPWQPLENAIAGGGCVGEYGTVYGWICAHLDVDLDEAATGFLFACLSASVNGAVRAMRLGQTDGQRIVTAMLPEIESAWREVAARNPWDFSTSLPAIDIAQMRHETLYSRLFMS